MKKIAIIYTKYSPVVDALKYTLSDYCVDCYTDFVNTEDYDLVIHLGDTDGYKGHALTCHYSLLPSFINCKEPVKEAILKGVKVTGVTVYYTDTKKIIAQYPIFIKNDTHYDNLKQELEYLEQTILPIVARKIINNEQFEMQELLNNNCGGKCNTTSCEGCASCRH